MSAVLFLVIIAIGFVAYRLGFNTGYEAGAGHGYVKGKTAGVQTWQRVLEGKRLNPDGELVAVHPARPPYDWTKEGL